MLPSLDRKMATRSPLHDRSGAAFAAIALAGWVSGCGGKVIFDADGTGGSGSAAVGASGTSTVSATSTHAVATSSTGTNPGCPKEDPIAGSSCDSEGLICALPNQCCDPSARCTGGKWQISAVDCASICVPCGPTIECADNAVCVTTQVDASVLHRCDANPCGTQALGCACASPLCGQAGQCISAGASQVSCDTLTD